MLYGAVKKQIGILGYDDVLKISYRLSMSFFMVYVTSLCPSKNKHGDLTKQFSKWIMNQEFNKNKFTFYIYKRFSMVVPVPKAFP